MTFHFDETFWVAAAFFVFLLVLMKPVGRIAAKGLDARIGRIRAELDEALKLKEEAQALLASYQRDHRSAMEEVSGITEHAKKEAERIIKSTSEKLDAEVKKRTELAMEKMQQAEASAIHDIQDSTVSVTINAARILIEENLGQDVADAIINTAISDVKRKFH